jgi:hypothetical protein
MLVEEYELIGKQHKKIVDLVVRYVKYVQEIDLTEEDDFDDLEKGILKILLNHK